MHGGQAPQHALQRKFWLLQRLQDAKICPEGQEIVDLLTIHGK